MPVRELTEKPEPMHRFPDNGLYRWLEMHDEDRVYGHAAIAERDDALELHVSLAEWGARVRRSIHADLDWLRGEARRLGKKRIMGIRVNSRGEFDKRLFRFARIYGFTDTCVLQTASLQID